MRRIVRTVAAGIVVILGLALVSAAALGVNTPSPLGRPDAPSDIVVNSISPFKLDPANKAAIPEAPALPDAFQSEFGKRGKHEVDVVVTGYANYAISFRGGPKPEWGLGNITRSRTVNGGFPVAQVAINGGGHVATCSIIVDGIEKDRQSTSVEEPVVFCEA